MGHTYSIPNIFLRFGNAQRSENAQLFIVPTFRDWHKYRIIENLIFDDVTINYTCGHDSTGLQTALQLTFSSALMFSEQNLGAFPATVPIKLLNV